MCPPLHFLPHTEIEIKRVMGRERESVTGVDDVEESKPDKLKTKQNSPSRWTKAKESQIGCVFEPYIWRTRNGRSVYVSIDVHSYSSFSPLSVMISFVSLSSSFCFWFLVSSTTATKILPSQTLSFDPKILNRLLTDHNRQTRWASAAPRTHR